MSPTTKLAAVSLILGIAILYLIAAGPEMIPTGDQAAFVLLAESLATGEGYRDIARPDRPVHTKFPPGFPLLLAATTNIPRTDPLDFRAEKLLVAICGLLSIGLTFHLVVHMIGGSRLDATIVAILLAINGKFFFLSHTIMSEAPFTAASLSLILAVDSWRKQSDKRIVGWRLAWVTVLIALCTAMRIAVIAHLAACGFYLLFGRTHNSRGERARPTSLSTKRRLAQTLVFALIAGTLLGSWVVRNQTVAGRSLDYLSQLFSKGERALVDESLATASEDGGFQRLTKGAIANFREIKTLLFLEDDVLAKLRLMKWMPEAVPFTLSWILSGLLGLILIRIVVRSVRERSLDALCGIATFGMVVFWPWTSFRFTAPVLPILLYDLVCGARITKRPGTTPGWKWVSRHPRLASFPSIAVVCLTAALNLGGTGFFLVNGNGTSYGGQTILSKPSTKSIYRGDYRDFFEVAREAGQRLDSQQRVLCSKPELFYVWSRIPATPFLPTGDPAKILDQIRRHRISHLMLDPLKPNPLRPLLQGSRNDGDNRGEQWIEIEGIRFREIFRQNRTRLFEVELG